MKPDGADQPLVYNVWAHSFIALDEAIREPTIATGAPACSSVTKYHAAPSSSRTRRAPAARAAILPLHIPRGLQPKPQSGLT